ncbi:T9SS type A sorting domain-containing protein [Fluviicola taffensis]|uniref:Secretion system C-terminal sorting domain-containing protein n=1 Tax=Fluviicola taffensis (strain DSM 16823 / NCIMB 13979 / RW262) TaxID=755732 RepID=F2IA61_FLUTR|nr:T9SS type A sorting domain-containing protein [Fluviicola taffensis]AEA45238.1 hypothetical protein Fluta_3265 [Fluviicola taffensis DSM 16823]
MRKQFCLFLFVFIVGVNHAQTTLNGSFVHNGISRTYSYYIPASYVPGQAVPLVMSLHGFTSSGTAHMASSHYMPIADTANFIALYPDGTIEPITSQRFWNYGNIMGSTVDDVGFLEALIDTISAHYSINQNRIYAAGMSNGSFMAYYLGCQTNRFAAIGAITGTMGIDMFNNCNPSHPTPRIHFHGTTDPINPYAGNSTSKGIDEVTTYWVNQNNCNTTPTITPIPDINTTDDCTAERHLYSGGTNGNTVELFKVIDGGHTWPGFSVFTLNGNICLDFNAGKELWRFFSQYELPATVSVTENEVNEAKVWPNPTSDRLYLKADDQIITEIKIIDMRGRMVQETKSDNIQFIDISQLNEGNYIVQISGNNFTVRKKIVIVNNEMY